MGNFSADHDLLVKLNENVISLREEVKQISANVSDKIADHEVRIRVLEASSDRAEGGVKANRLLLAVVSVVLLALEVFYYYFHK